MSENKMYHFKHMTTGGITFIGFNDEKKVYSQDYYANVGICNAEESKLTSLTTVKKLYQSCVEMGFKKVTYLPGHEPYMEKGK